MLKVVEYIRLPVLGNSRREGRKGGMGGREKRRDGREAGRRGCTGDRMWKGLVRERECLGRMEDAKQEVDTQIN